MISVVNIVEQSVIQMNWVRSYVIDYSILVIHIISIKVKFDERN